jgi:hypothetical protein
MLRRNTIQLWQEIFVIGFFSLYMMENWSTMSAFSDKTLFSYVEKWISRTISTGVNKIQDLFTNFLFIMKKLVFGVR